MRNLLIRPLCGLVLMLCASIAAAQSAGGVRIELSGLENASGNIYIAVYDSDEDWLGDDVLMGKKVAIADALEDKLVRVDLDLAPGNYAISIFYDSNDNGELDTNFIGIPNEPVALSNNAKGRFGPPKYEDAVFTVGAEQVVQGIAIKAH